MKQLRKRIAALLVSSLLLASIGPARQAYAATIEVTTFADNLSNNGDCSLREAIQAANTDSVVDACPAGSGTDTIRLSDGTYTLSIPIAIGGNDNSTGDLNITSDLTIVGIDGNTVWIDAGQIDRVFSIQPGATVTLRGFEITHGASTANGGGIHNGGTLTLDGVNVADTTADGNGGGIYNDHGVLIVYGNIRDNAAGGNGGGIDNNGGTLTIDRAIFNNNVAGNSGGAISNNAVLALDRVWIHDNSASGNAGGAIYNSGALTISNSFIHNSSAPQDGGNIYSGDNSDLSTLTMTRTTISQGQAGANGGGVFNNGALHLTNVTITMNSAASGGGIYNAETTQPLNITNTTIVSNTNSLANPGGGIVNAGSGLTLKNTLVGFNGTLGNCAGSISSVGYNLDSGNTCGFTATGDLTNTNPLLSQLKDNGGTTFPYGGAAPSYALLSGSPAINGGTNQGCPAIDQRGMSRPHGARCDIGAYEANDAPRAAADSYSTNEDTPLIAIPPGLLTNDSDPDSDVITATLVMAPSHGVLTLSSSGAFNYTPEANYHGQDSFSYQIGDGSMISTSTPVTLTVISVNDPPVAADDVASTVIDTALIIPVSLLLSNDTDIEGDSLNISGVRGNSARGGRVTLAGGVIYTPPTHFSGLDSLIYTLSDGNGGTASGTVMVTVGMQRLYLPAVRR